MKAFRITALNSKGHYIQKIIKASNETTVHALCEKNNWALLNLTLKATKEPSIQKVKIDPLALSYTCRQLAKLLKAGIPLLKAIENTRQSNTKNIHLSHVLTHTQKALNNGESLALALKPYTTTLTPIVYHTLKIGEQSNTLSLAFENVSEWLNDRHKFLTHLKTSTYYPLCMLGFILILLIGFLIAIVPQFKNLFYHLLGPQTPLPLFTKNLIYISDAMIHNPISIIITTSLIIYGSILLFRINKIKKYFLKRIMKLPYIQTCFKHYQYKQLFQILSLLLKNQTPPSLALTLTANSVTNTTNLQRSIYQSIEHLRQGHTLATALIKENLIPYDFLGLMEASEYTYELPQTLQYIADIEATHLQEKLQSILKWIEPLLTTLLALIIGGLILTLFYPIMILLDKITF